MEGEKVIVTHPDSWTVDQIQDAILADYLHRAIEIGESYYGLHGFEIDEWEGDEDDQADAIADFLYDQAEVIAEQWNEDKHIGNVTYNGFISENELIFE
jgi:hypothetical protein